MKKRKHKISGWRVVLAAILFAVVSQIVHSLGAIGSMRYYLMSDYFPVWSKIMMPTAGAPPATFYYYSVGFALVTGFLFALVYMVLKHSIPGKSLAARGAMYGFLVFLLSTVPGMLMLYLIINLPTGILWLWAFEGLVINLIGGVIVAVIEK